VSAVVASEDAIATTAGPHVTSDAVLVWVAPGLAALGFSVEVGKRSADKISRPVLFGEGGAPDVTMDIDGFHDELGIVLEIEAGRAGTATPCRAPRPHPPRSSPTRGTSC